jgi:hypothetical protein
MDLKRLGVTLIGLVALTGVVWAQDTPMTLPSHVIVDSCSGCGGGTTDTDDGSIAAGQTTSIPVALDYGYDSTAGTWKRHTAVALTNAFAATVAIVDGSGNQITSFGGGTQYVNGVANAGPTGTLALGYDGANLRALLTNSSGHQYVIFPSAQSVTSTNLPATVDTNSGVKSASTLRVVLATDQPALTNKLLVTPDSVALPANQSVNVNQIAGTASAVNSGVKDNGTLRVVLATDQPQLTNKLLVTPDANSAVNVAQFGGSAVATGTGTGGAGIPRVTISNDSSLAANQSTNVAQFGGSAVATGVGAAGSGVPRVTVSNDNVETTGTINATPLNFQVALAGMTAAGLEIQAATGGAMTATVNYQYSADGGTTWGSAFAVAGGAEVVSTAYTGAVVSAHFILGEHWTHIRANVSAYAGPGTASIAVRATKIVSPLAVGALHVGVNGLTAPTWTAQNGSVATTATPTAVTATTLVTNKADVYGVQYERQDHPARFRCNMDSSATTSTVITGCVGSAATLAAPAAGLAYYITDISFYVSVISTTTNRSVLQTGTGGTCGTGTSILWAGYAGTAFTGNEAHFLTPLRATTIGEVCFLNAVAGQKLMTVSGFLAP